MENLQELKALLAIPKDIVLTSHRNPDGDAIGACLALYHFLNKFGHTVRIIVPSEFPAFLDWMPGASEILIFDLEPERSHELVKRADLIFCLDFNALDRIDKLGEPIPELNTPIVLIDHHLYPEGFADFLLSDPDASSTCELVYRFIHLLGEQRKLDTAIGECLYTGIITDTGSFKFSTNPELFRIVAELLELGVNDYRIQDRVFNCMTEKQLRLLGHVLSRRMEILEEFHTGIITLTKRDYEEFDIQRGDTEGLVNYPLMLKNIKMVAFIHEQPTITKISLRSKGDFSVEEIARDHFRGGGHRNAAGGYSFKGLRKTVEKFKSILPLYKEALENSKV